MERIGRLIEQLNQQFKNKVPPAQLLSTVQLLQNELTGTIREVDVLGTSGISVIVPNAKPLQPAAMAGTSEKEGNAEKEYFELIVEPNPEEEGNAEPASNVPSYEELMKYQKEAKKGKQPQATLSFKEPAEEEASELPTLARQGKSGSRAARQAPKASKNAVKDLNKAINAQDKIVFVKELFRGDEVMFERSIKTINNFNSLAQAEYWIRRELRTKNGWLAGNPVVQQFEQLVKRRFA
ncbi:hypothetical protein ABDK00_008460 [Niabella insulamsoli]|uniref:hypothetical protein n=1 Tax=Niabella insulamsoli TaxID=3144874 RepID=UPI0031FD7C77